jgi:hypothetical protein
VAAGVGVAGAASGGAAGAGAAGSAGAAGATAGGSAAAGGGVSTTAVVAGGVGVGAVATAAVVGYVVLSNALFGHNLVQNANADASAGATGDQTVKPSNWQTEGNFSVVQYGTPNVMSANDPGPPDRGKNLFTGGPDNARSKATQTIDVSGGSGGIDGGNKEYTLSAWLGGFQGQEDNATVVVTFQDGNGNSLGTNKIGPVSSVARRSVTSLVRSETTGKVPKNTRKVVIDIIMVRSEGSYNDGYADDVSFVIK